MSDEAVVMAVGWCDPATGEKHMPGDTVLLAAATARRLLRDGFARAGVVEDVPGAVPAHAEALRDEASARGRADEAPGSGVSAGRSNGGAE